MSKITQKEENDKIEETIDLLTDKTDLERIEDIDKKISILKKEIEALEEKKKEIQSNCDHYFVWNDRYDYVECDKCKYSENR